MPIEEVLIDPGKNIDFSEALSNLSSIETVPFKKTPLFVAQSVAPLHQALLRENPDQTFEQTAHMVIGRSKQFDRALLGQQITRTLERIIYQGVLIDIIPNKFEHLATGIGGYLVGLPNEPRTMQRFMVTKAVAESLYNFINTNLWERSLHLGPNVHMDDILSMLTDGGYDPQLHVYLDSVYGSFLKELRTLQVESPVCDTFRKTRKELVERPAGYEVDYSIDPIQQVILQSYGRLTYTGPVYANHYVRLTQPERKNLQLLSRLPIVGMPLVRGVAEAWRELHGIPQDTYGSVDGAILSPELVNEINVLKSGQPSVFDSGEFRKNLFI